MALNFKRSLIEKRARPTAAKDGLLARLQRFFTIEVWRFEPEGLTFLRRALRRASRLVFLTLNGFVGDRCIVRASALTYVTVLSIVPLLAFSFASVKGLGFYEDFRSGVVDPAVERLLPSIEVEVDGDPSAVPVLETPPLREPIEQLLTLVETTDLKGLAATGAVIVLWAIVRLLGTVEAALNEIWGVRRARSLVRKLTDYVSIVVIAPLGAVLMIGLTSATQSGAFGAFLDDTLGWGRLVRGVVRAAPLLAGWVVFTFVYVALPNTRTRFKSAALGGLVAAALWWLALWVHLQFQIGVAKYNLIYSTFAAIPIFLVWVQSSWLIVLFGAELAFAHQHERDYRREVAWREASAAASAGIALRSMARIVQAFLAGDPAPTAEVLASELSVPVQPVDDAMDALASVGLVAAVGDEDEPGWLVARDPEGIRAVEVLEALEGEHQAAPAAPTGIDREVQRVLDRLSEERRASIHNLSLRELAQRGARELDVDQAGLGEAEPQPS